MPVLALPALAIIGALLALLLLYGARSLTHLLRHLLDIGIPGTSINIGSGIESLLNVALSVVQAYLDDAAAPIAKVISYPVTAAKYILSNIADALSETGVAIRVIKRTFVPHLIAVAVSQLRQWIATVENVLLADIVAARNYALGLVNAARAYALGLANHVYAVLRAALTAAIGMLLAKIATAVASLTHLIAAVQAHVLAVVASVEASLIARIVGLQAWTAAQIQHALAFTAQRFAQAEADIVAAERAAIAESIALVDAGVVHGLSDVWGDVTSAAAAAEGVIAADFPDILAGLRSITRSVPADIAGVAALTGGLSIALTRYLEKCGVPNCRNLSGLGRDLQALLGMAEGLAFAELVAELVHNPAGAAADIRDTLGVLADDTIGLATSAFGT